jgi:hypothetical protein
VLADVEDGITWRVPESLAAARASRSKRSRISLARAWRSARSLTATVRPSTESVARYTSAIPPRATGVGDA